MNRIFILIFFVTASAIASAGDPAIPGYHPLSQTQAGQLLMDELRCAACHSGMEKSSLPTKTAPDLSEVGTRVSPEFLQRFLASPSKAHSGTTMPDMLASKPETERQSIAEALTHFLVSQSKKAEPTSSAGPIDRIQGKELFHSIGCVACHGPRIELSDSVQATNRAEEEDEEDMEPAQKARKAIKPSDVALDHVAAKYNTQSLSEFLFQPMKVRSSGRMPDMKLTPAEASAIASYLVGEQVPTKALVPDASLVIEGRKHFQSLNCASCHSIPGIEAAPTVGSIKTVDLSRGCLSKADVKTETIRKDSPRFELDANQLSAIRAAIKATPIANSEKDVLAQTLTALRCTNCHVRDDYGGVHDSHNAYFKGSQLNLGDDGRIPPPLTLMGAKLQPAWMKKVLFDGESVRHYMSTRMPQYGSLHHLPELFRRLDVLEGPQMTIPKPEGRNEAERQKEKLIRAAGRELLGDKGANCVACHNFNGKAANVNQGIDLLTSYERLQPAWFQAYLKKPGAFRPRTVMPSAWPDGVATFKTILDGDTHQQIEAIWYYLSLGTSAADPSGVKAVSTKLEVGEKAVIHRGRSRVAGFRGIAVGLPEKLHYAFNAENGTLSAIWSGPFVSVNWSGQGSGDFNPASAPISLAQDVSFASLTDEKAPWPLMPVMTKETPVNPNPLYPKNVGYQFRGYFLDESLVPTFQYRSGNLEIEDRTAAIGEETLMKLKRVLRFESPAPQSIWFRAMVGEIRQESDLVFRIEGLRVAVPDTHTQLRILSDAPERQELLLRIEVPQGKSTLELQYELLKK